LYVETLGWLTPNPKRASEPDSPIALSESAPLDIVRPGGSTNDEVGESEQ